MNKQFEMVKAFHTACDIEMPNKPTYLKGGKDDVPMIDKLEPICEEMKSIKGNEVMSRASWMLEELIEFIDAAHIEDQADALIDLIYFAIGTFTLMGIKPEPIFDIVQSANMGKVGPDGKVLRNDQGKIQKPEGWQENFAPESRIKAEIERQLQESKGGA
jgi:predicted HAD superfamily Cof-like phosphohydrolase